MPSVQRPSADCIFLVLCTLAKPWLSVCLDRYATVNILVEVPMDMDRIELIKERFLTLASCMPIEKFLSGWFLGAPSESVLRGNVEDFIAYGFYCRRLDQLSQQVGTLIIRKICHQVMSSCTIRYILCSWQTVRAIFCWAWNLLFMLGNLSWLVAHHSRRKRLPLPGHIKVR